MRPLSENNAIHAMYTTQFREHLQRDIAHQLINARPTLVTILCNQYQIGSRLQALTMVEFLAPVRLQHDWLACLWIAQAAYCFQNARTYLLILLTRRHTALRLPSRYINHDALN